VIVTVRFTDGVNVVTVKAWLAAPAPIVTAAGTDAAALLLDNAILAPPAGAVAVSTTVAVTVPFPVMLV
jgi:hypothetical protein